MFRERLIYIHKKLSHCIPDGIMLPLQPTTAFHEEKLVEEPV